MASQQPLKTVTLSGSFPTGPSGGLIPAAPTNRLQDFPLPGGYTPAGERFNFTILASLASPLVVAIIIIVIEIIACYRWRRKTAGLRKSTHPQPRTSSNSPRRIVAELPSGTVAELEARSESRLAVSSETSTTHISANVKSSTGDAGAAGGVSDSGEAGERLWMLSTDNAGRRVSNTDNVGSADGISSNEEAKGALGEFGD